jgi:hypothetical protein
MKHLLTAFACLFIMNMSAQTGFVEFPYNPDSDNDDMIGTEDLLGLLSLYGSEFSEEGLYLDEDSTHAIISMGNMNYPSCMLQCRSLLGNWRIANQEDLLLHYDDLAPSGNGQVKIWLFIDLKENNANYAPRLHLMGPNWSTYNGINIDYDSGNSTTSGRLANSSLCYCATHERPNVEYTFCNGAWELMLECAEEKTELGWYPLGHISPEGTTGHFAQAFWRWAE